jgi:hypothetical protein
MEEGASVSPAGAVDWVPMEVGVAAGLIGRVWSLRTGRRAYPGWPSGYINQFALGVIAALIGGSVVTSLISKEFTAATFLTLAATQFFDLRQTERKSLEQEEDLLLVSRGAGYIEGIAKTYEARNYLAMLVALVASAVTALFGLIPGIVAGIAAVIVSDYMMQGPMIGDIIHVSVGKVHFEKDSLLYVDDVMLMEVGLPKTRERWLKEGVGIVFTPKNPRGQAILWNLSQRQALTHEAAVAVGAQIDVGYPDHAPLTRMEMPGANGRAALGILPIDPDIDRLIKALQQTPVLESSKWERLRSPILARGDVDR